MPIWNRRASVLVFASFSGVGGMNEEGYWRWQTKRVAVLMVTVCAGVVFGMPFAVAAFDDVARADTGAAFLMSAEGGLVLLVLMLFWYCAKENRAERELDTFRDD